MMVDVGGRDIGLSIDLFVDIDNFNVFSFCGNVLRMYSVQLSYLFWFCVCAIG